MGCNSRQVFHAPSSSPVGRIHPELPEGHFLVGAGGPILDEADGVEEGDEADLGPHLDDETLEAVQQLIVHQLLDDGLGRLQQLPERNRRALTICYPFGSNGLERTKTSNRSA